LTVEGALVHLKEHGELITDDLKIIRSHRSGLSRVLDIGAGRGSFVIEARRQGVEALGLDLDLDAPRVWRPAHVPGVIGEGQHAPFVAGAFDVVRLKEVIEHVQDPLALVREARRLLSPGGLFIAHVPSQYSQFYPVANFWDDYTHVRPFSRFALQRLMSDGGLAVESIFGYMSGRNTVERALGRVLGRFLPHVYRVVATAPARGST
jgi:SAM-dependent methyltransferase